MVPKPIIIAANLAQTAVPIIGLLAYVPQWSKLLRTKSTEGISMRSWLMWTVSTCFALFYAIVQLLLNGRGWALVFSTAISLLFVLTTVALILNARLPKD